jgi:excisionase family DNA binding protein
VRGAVGVHHPSPLAPFPTKFAAPVQHGSRLRAIDGGAGRLLSVREVAQHLGLSTATVYKLVARGELAHVRVSNAIRFERAEVERFVSARRQDRRDARGPLGHNGAS